MYKTFEELVAALCDADKNLNSREVITVGALQSYYEDEQ